MNVKPGDLAYIVGDIPEAGVIVTVIAPWGEDPDFGLGFCWTCQCSRPQLAARGWSTRFELPDANLRPISGVPVTDDVTEDLKEPA